MHSVLITGANRGLGLEFVKQCLAHPTLAPNNLIATARNPLEATELQQIASKDKRLHVLQFDVTKFDEIPNLVASVEHIVGDKGLTVLFNNAGILISRNGTLENFVDSENLSKNFTTNTIAPICLTKAFLPLLRKAAVSNKEQKFGINRAAILFTSSALGSVSGNESAGFWCYRESKAALNMAARSIAKEVKDDGIAVLLLHPGWVQTDMGGKDALITPEVSIKGLLKVIANLDENTHGKFIDYSGKIVPW